MFATEVDITLAQIGCTTMAELNSDYLWDS